MTTKELQKRNEKSQVLKVLRANGDFFVESAEGMVLYRVNPNGKDDQTNFSCTCGDYARGVKNDPHFQCKHVLSVLGCVPNGEFEDAEFLERKKPKLDERFIKSIEGRDFVLYSGLLDLAHQKGLVEDRSGSPSVSHQGERVFCNLQGYGHIQVRGNIRGRGRCESTQLQCQSRQASSPDGQHESEGKGFAGLRRIGMTCLEELGDLDEVIGEEASEQGKFRKPIPKKVAKPAEPQPAEETKAEKGNGSNGGNG